MSRHDPKLMLQPAPLLAQGMTTPGAMRDVLIALAPATLAALWFFGLAALLVLLAAILGAVATEWAFTPADARRHALGDGSALLTGLLLGLTLPPALPLWIAFIGGAVAIGLGKLVWGGLGRNLFNPALVGRAFLLGAFPTAMTSWSPPRGQGFFDLYSTTWAAPFTRVELDAVSAATPLGLMKFEQTGTDLWDLMWGHTAGSLGETSGLLLIVGGLYLWWRRDLDWRIPLATLGSAALLAFVLQLFDTGLPGPLFTVFAGGLLLGALFMATDPVTSPLTPRGAWIFGAGIGLLVVMIRNFGGLPEGALYAILFMNAWVPLIDRFTQPRVFGRGRAG